MDNKTMFSSKSTDWSTPQEFYNEIDTRYNFTLDPCANDSNNKCDKYFTEEEDGLNQDWSGETVFMNPPYGKNVKRWIRKAWEEGQKPNTTVVCLLPARTDTRYWHDYCMRADEIFFIKGRLKFGGSSNGAPFPSSLVVFGPRQAPTMRPMDKSGKLL